MTMHSCKKERKSYDPIVFFSNKNIHLLYTEAIALFIDGFKGHVHDFRSQNDISNLVFKAFYFQLNALLDCVLWSGKHHNSLATLEQFLQ